jgi:hypothetical protein
MPPIIPVTTVVVAVKYATNARYVGVMCYALGLGARYPDVPVTPPHHRTREVRAGKYASAAQKNGPYTGSLEIQYV